MIYFFYFFCVEEWKEQRERKSNYRSGLIQFKLLSTTDEFTFSIYLLLSLSHTHSLCHFLSLSLKIPQLPQYLNRNFMDFCMVNVAGSAYVGPTGLYPTDIANYIL